MPKPGYTSPTGHFQVWYTKSGAVHRDDGPAYANMNLDSPGPQLEWWGPQLEWWVDGLHQRNAPNVIKKRFADHA